MTAKECPLCVRAYGEGGGELCACVMEGNVSFAVTIISYANGLQWKMRKQMLSCDLASGRTGGVSDSVDSWEDRDD